MGHRGTLLALGALLAACAGDPVDAVEWACLEDTDCGPAGGGTTCYLNAFQDAGVCVATLAEGRNMVLEGPASRGCSLALQQFVDCTHEQPYAVLEIERFAIAPFEVFAGDYDACPDCPPRQIDLAPECNDGADTTAYFRPANCVSWEGARAYCDFIGGRLCSEAEWEKAATGPCEITLGCTQPSRPYPTGYEPPTCNDAVVFDFDNPECNANATLSALDKPGDVSPYGVFAMAGNVGEWVADCFVSGYEVQPIDGSAHEVEGACAERSIRGGSYAVPNFDALVFRRRHAPPNAVSPELGIRCCFDVPRLGQ